MALVCGWRVRPAAHWPTGRGGSAHGWMVCRVDAGFPARSASSSWPLRIPLGDLRARIPTGRGSHRGAAPASVSLQEPLSAGSCAPPAAGPLPSRGSTDLCPLGVLYFVGFQGDFLVPDRWLRRWGAISGDALRGGSWHPPPPQCRMGLCVSLDIRVKVAGCLLKWGTEVGLPCTLSLAVERGGGGGLPGVRLSAASSPVPWFSGNGPPPGVSLMRASHWGQQVTERPSPLPLPPSARERR